MVPRFLPSLLTFLLLGPGAGTCAQRRRQAFAPSLFDRLDYGIYFFGKGNANEKYVGRRNAFFDPTRPTMLYVHGWLPGKVAKRERPTFDSAVVPGAPEGKDLAEGWIEQGFNVGMFYWNQFADEGNVAHAEAKIWTAGGAKGMRWRRATDGAYCHEGPQESVAEVLARYYRAAFAEATGEVRLVGHSLGGQAVIAAAELLLNDTTAPVPARIAILDGAFFRTSRPYLPGKQSTALAAAAAAKRLRTAGVLLEAYRSSYLSSNYFVDASELLGVCAYSELHPGFFRPWQIIEKHVMAKWWYFDSINAPPSQTEVLSASSPSGVVLRWMNSNSSLAQTGGLLTKDTADDTFAFKPKKFFVQAGVSAAA